MKAWKKLLAVGFVAGTITACGTTTKQDETAAPADAGKTPSAIKGGDVAGPSGTESLSNTVYFDFDKSDVHAEDRSTIAGHAKLLVKNRGKKVTLEGHADERGTVEYNMALSERRAKAVKDALMAQGASGDQVKTASYGEGRPAAQGHDESAWSKNRRVEVVGQ
jgi:peptidoglycan-associated lipoprotein